MTRPFPPCKDCERRSMTCHTVCREYLEYKRMMDDYNTVRNAELEKYQPIASRMKAINRAIKRKRKQT